MNAEWAAWYAAVGFTVMTVCLWDRRERGNALGYAVLVIVAALTATYWARALQESGVYDVGPSFYGYTRFAAGTGAFLGVAATIVGQARSARRPSLISETAGIRTATERRAHAAEVANARNARIDAAGGEVTALTEASRLADSTDRLADAAEKENTP